MKPPKGATMKARVNLEGPAEDVNAVLGMALEQGLLHSFTVEDSVVSKPKRRRSAKAKAKGSPTSKGYNPGTRVEVRHTRTEYPEATKGRLGAVATSRRRGKGYRVLVRWDGGGESWVASTLLGPTSKQSLRSA